MSKLKDITGKRFGRLVAICRSTDSSYHRVRFKCKCDCGNEKDIVSSSLILGLTRSCGCIAREMGAIRCKIAHPGLKHGHGKNPTRAYTAWASAKSRCSNPRYRDYHGRGITFCDRWNQFENFLLDMGQPRDGMSLDRIDNNGNYEPSNCRWATRSEQERNKRKVSAIENFTDEQIEKEYNKRMENLYKQDARLMEVAA